MRLAVAAVLFLAPTTAMAANCSLMLLKDDLPDCVRELNSKIFLLQAELQAAQSEARLYRSLVCNLALHAQKTSPDEYTPAIVDGACAELKAASKAKHKPAK